MQVDAGATSAAPGTPIAAPDAPDDLREAPLQAVRSATAIAAKVLRQAERIGSIATGRLADLGAVDRAPLADVRALERVRWIMNGGVVYPPVK